MNKGVGVALVDNFSRLEQVYGGVVTRPFEPASRSASPAPALEAVSHLVAEFIQVARKVLTVDRERQP